MGVGAMACLARPKFTLLTVAAALALGGGAVWGQPAAEDALPYAGAPAPAQLDVLAPWVGAWSLDIQVAPGAANPQGMRFTGRAVGRREFNGQFIRVDGRTSNGKTREEYSALYWYDAGKAVYRRAYFSSIGLASFFEGRWDEAKREMTWTLMNPRENQRGTVVEAIGPKGITTRVAYTDGAGTLVRSAVNQATRTSSP